MKTMLRKLMAFAFFTFVFAGVQAQNQDEVNRAIKKHDQKQARQTHWGAGITIGVPMDPLKNAYSTGFGLNLTVDKQMTKLLSITGDVGWTQYFGKEVNNVELDDASMFHILAGAKVRIPLVYLEGRTGYLFGDKDIDAQWVFIPAVGLRAGPFDLNIGWQVLGDAKYMPIRITYIFGGRRK
jgi:hypothetical protein